jgi:carbon storage regulator
MLILSRKEGESVKVADDIEITVISVSGNRVRIGINAPRNVRILRAELDDTTAAKSNTDSAVQPLVGSDLLKKAAAFKKEHPTPTKIDTAEPTESK